MTFWDSSFLACVAWLAVGGQKVLFWDVHEQNPFFSTSSRSQNFLNVIQKVICGRQARSCVTWVYGMAWNSPHSFLRNTSFPIVWTCLSCRLPHCKLFKEAQRRRTMKSETRSCKNLFPRPCSCTFKLADYSQCFIKACVRSEIIFLWVVALLQYYGYYIWLSHIYKTNKRHKHKSARC